jgi:hypothetical protein
VGIVQHPLFKLGMPGHGGKDAIGALEVCQFIWFIEPVRSPANPRKVLFVTACGTCILLPCISVKIAVYTKYIFP